jgi:CDP-paratose 2-epimerase
MGHTLHWTYQEANRIGDHICYISDLSKLQSHFPAWRLEFSLERIVEQLLAAARQRQGAR